MAILRSTDGKFYEVDDDQLEDKLIPAEEIRDKLGDAGGEPAEYGPGPMTIPSGGPVTIQIFTSPEAGEGPPPEDAEGGGGEVSAHGYCYRRRPRWHNHCWRNYWRRNCWRNHCY